MVKYKSGEKPKIGDRIKLIDNNMCAAKVGATATVTDYDYTSWGNYIKVKWERNKLDMGQNDGGYNAENFELLKNKIGSLKEFLKNGK